MRLDLIDQRITVSPYGEKRFGDPPFEIEATADSGLPVQFTLVYGPGILDGNELTITGNGTVSILLEQPGNADYEPAQPVEIIFDTGSIAGPVLSFETLPSGVRVEVPWYSTRHLGVEYSPDLARGSWIELGNFFLDRGRGVFVDSDPVRRARSGGFYRAFLRPVIPD